jgi:hypothetical protein
MPHKFAIGTAVYYDSGFLSDAVRGVYTITKQLPVERDERIAYLIKSRAEAFERTAEESQLRRPADLP